MGAPLDNAIGLYLHGIRDGHPREAVERHVGGRYRQHSTGVPDGTDGFVAFFDDFLRRTPRRDIRVVRTIENGRHVFLHVHQDLNDGAAEWVTADFFDTDAAGRVVEHWDVIAPYTAPTPPGPSTIDGPTEIADLPRTYVNKAIVRELITEILMDGGDPGRVDEFVAEDYVEHNAELADGREALRARAGAPDRPCVYDEIVLLVGEGNFVATLCRTRCDGALHRPRFRTALPKRENPRSPRGDRGLHVRESRAVQRF